MSTFDPNAPASSSSGIFGLPYSEAEADLVLLPVPWAVTVSYGSGADKGPQAIFDASMQVDLYESSFPNVWECKTAMMPISKSIKKDSKHLRTLAETYIDGLIRGTESDKNEQAFLLKNIDAGCQAMNQWVEKKTMALINKGKMVGLIGGDHSTPFGAVRALSTKFPQLSILQIDAHCDLRSAYEGFTYSHASISRNIHQELPDLKALVQVGIRDLCDEEAKYAEQHDNIHLFTDRWMQDSLANGQTWNQTLNNIIEPLGQDVYLSFDIDGLEPSLCPNTGTPVPGGLSFYHAVSLIQSIHRSGRKLIGFDLVEVVPGDSEWDANVGARILFHLCTESHRSKLSENQ
ncbi:MAG: agmatinase family protein [Bacteroidetes bacterium]|nr:agmatinase family protein [Bacteroidota bacterium]